MNYFLRGIDKNFWHKVKTKALAKKQSIREIILDLLVKWIRG